MGRGICFYGSIAKARDCWMIDGGSPFALARAIADVRAHKGRSVRTAINRSRLQRSCRSMTPVSATFVQERDRRLLSLEKHPTHYQNRCCCRMEASRRSFCRGRHLSLRGAGSSEAVIQANSVGRTARARDRPARRPVTSLSPRKWNGDRKRTVVKARGRFVRHHATLPKGILLHSGAWYDFRDGDCVPLR